MSWIKLDDRFADHPKVVNAGPTAAWLFVCGLCYCAKYLTDGLIPKAQVRKLADIDDVKQMESKLVSAGLWEDAGDSYRVHDYLEYNMSREQSLSLSEKRREIGKRGGRPRQENQTESNLVSKTKANVKQNESKTKAVPVPVFVPVPDPVPVPTSTTLATAPRKRPRGNGTPPDSAVVWIAFQTAYVRRYGVEHPRSQTVNSQMVQFIGRIGLEEAPFVAAFFVSHNKAYYVQQRHTVGAMLRDAEALHTDWATGCKSSQREGREADRMQADDEMWERIDQRMEARRNTVEAIG